MLAYQIEQIKGSHAQGVGNNPQSIVRRIGLSILYPAEIRLVEATLLPELDLAQSYLLP